MIPIVLLIAAIACVAAAVVLLRSLGTRYRVGRLLAAAPAVEIEEAQAMASGSSDYVRVTGRITSDEEFPDENDRPLVFRRKRIQVGGGTGGRSGRGDWRTIADEREAVPFGLETRSAYIAIDVATIGDGLVAIPRESVGKFSDLPAELTADVDDPPPADTPARLVIEQLSAVEHATACGTPLLRNGKPTLTAGAGRPLIITTLEAPAAMRLLATGNRSRVVAAAALFVAAGVLAVGFLVTGVLGL